MPMYTQKKNPTKNQTHKKPNRWGTRAQISKIFSHCTPSFEISSDLCKSFWKACRVLLHHRLRQDRLERQPETSYINERVSGWRTVERRSALLIKKLKQHLNILKRFNSQVLNRLAKLQGFPTSAGFSWLIALPRWRRKRWKVGEMDMAAHRRRQDDNCHAVAALHESCQNTPALPSLALLQRGAKQTLPTWSMVLHHKHKPSKKEPALQSRSRCTRCADTSPIHTGQNQPW